MFPVTHRVILISSRCIFLDLTIDKDILPFENVLFADKRLKTNLWLTCQRRLLLQTLSSGISVFFWLVTLDITCSCTFWSINWFSSEGFPKAIEYIQLTMYEKARLYSYD